MQCINNNNFYVRCDNQLTIFAYDFEITVLKWGGTGLFFSV